MSGFNFSPRELARFEVERFAAALLEAFADHVIEPELRHALELWRAESLYVEMDGVAPGALT